MKTNLTKVVIVMALLVSYFYSGAQEKVWSIGGEIGVNFSKYGMDATDNDFNSGVVGGLFLTYSIVNTFGITTKVLYSEKGSAQGTSEQTLKYIEVPIIGRFFLNKEGKFRPNIFLGPSFGFLRGVTNQIGSNDPVKVSNFDVAYNTFDLGVTGGLGLNYEIIPETRILIDARYNHGLTDITKATGKINNQTFGITAGISFGI
jgi:hypothetical protein